MFKLISLFTILLTLSACNGPLSIIPGGALNGNQTPLTLDAIPPEGGIIALETNPQDPYSVYVGFVVVNKNMYIDPAAERTWYQYIKDNNAVRIRFDGGEDIHPARAIVETDKNVLTNFEADRIVLRLDPR